MNWRVRRQCACGRVYKYMHDDGDPGECEVCQGEREDAQRGDNDD